MAQPTRYLKTRLAPTPSGYLHLGNAYSFALTAALAEKTGARLFLRIDDQDANRVQEDYLQDIFDTLHFLDIPWQEGPRDVLDFQAQYSQRYRQQAYQQALDRLREMDLLYACTCSRAQLQAQGYGHQYPGTCRHKNIPLDTPDVAWRLKTDATKLVRLRMYGGEERLTCLEAETQNMVLRRKDGLAAYQLSSVIDDVFYGIDLVVRGQDLWPSSVFQLYLAELLGLQEFHRTTFLHHALFRTEAGEKMSKSAGATSIRQMRLQGLKREAVYARMGEVLGQSKRLAHWRDLVAGL